MFKIHFYILDIQIGNLFEKYVFKKNLEYFSKIKRGIEFTLSKMLSFIHSWLKYTHPRLDLLIENRKKKKQP